MDEKEMAKKAVKNLLIFTGVKWGLLIGLNAIWRRQLRKAKT